MAVPYHPGDISRSNTLSTHKRTTGMPPPLAATSPRPRPPAPGSLQVRAVSAVMLRQDGDSSSCWNVDGEMLEDAALGLRVHRGLVDVFARGPAC